MASKRKTILHIISGLRIGGAEGVLYRTVSRSTNFDHIIISLTDGGYYEQKLLERGIKVFCFKIDKISGLFFLAPRLIRLFVTEEISVIQSWLYHADIFTIVLKFLGVRQPIFWAVRNSTLDKSSNNLMLRIMVGVLARVSRNVPTGISFNSYASKRHHTEQGYEPTKCTIIRNGFCAANFQNPNSALISQSTKLQQDIVVGMLCRPHPQKGIDFFLSGIAKIESLGLPVQFLLAGPTLDQEGHYTNLAKSYGLKSIKFEGAYSDPRKFYAKLDVFALTSLYGESFPNVLAEAMLMGLPCITSNVGDAATIVSDYGWVFEPGDHPGFCSRVEESVSMFQCRESWHQLTQQCRKSIAERFDINVMVGQFEKLWHKSF